MKKFFDIEFDAPKMNTEELEENIKEARALLSYLLYYSKLRKMANIKHSS